MNEKTDVHIFIWQATPYLHCTRRFCHSYLRKQKTINNKFLNINMFVYRWYLLICRTGLGKVFCDYLGRLIATSNLGGRKASWLESAAGEVSRTVITFILLFYHHFQYMWIYLRFNVVNGHCNHLALKFSVCVKERQDRLPTRYWLPKLHRRPYKARFIANSCTTTELSKLLTSCITTVKNHFIRYCEKVYERSGKNLFWSINNSGEVLNKLKSRGFRATSLSTYDFSTLYTTLPHNLIKEKLLNLIEWTFKREGSPYIACNERQAFFTSEDTKRYKLWSCRNVFEALIYLLDNIYIRFGTKLYRQIVGIPMGTNCDPLVADLFLFCYERDFMTSLSDVKQAEIIEAFCYT